MLIGLHSATPHHPSSISNSHKTASSLGNNVERPVPNHSHKPSHHTHPQDKHQQKRLVRVYLDEHTWWTLPLTNNSTAKEVCGSVAAKLERSEEAFQLCELNGKTNATKVLKADQLIPALIDSWGANKDNHRLLVKEISKFSPLHESTPNFKPRNLHTESVANPAMDKRLSISVKQLQRLTGIPDEFALEPTELEIMEKISAGASSRVYRGKFRGEDVALKIMKTNTEEDHLDTFTKELLICTEVASPHLVKFYGACVLPPVKVCLVMEYCTRGSLYQVLKDKTLNCDWEMFFNFTTGMVRGINALHSWNPVIVHRDLKSQNLLVTEDWKIKVCDFGLSRTSSINNQNSLSKLRGTYAYAAPEVYYGDKYSSKSDVYSMAVVVWELLTRIIRGVYVHPFSDQRTTISFEFQLVIEAAKGLRPTVPPTCPVPLAELLGWMWSTDPKQRPNVLQVLDKVEYLHRDFLEHPEAWNNAIEPHARSEDPPKRRGSAPSIPELALLKEEINALSRASSTPAPISPKLPQKLSPKTNTAPAAPNSREDNTKQTT